MNDAEFRRRAHALLERCVVREEATGTKWTGELRALLAAGEALSPNERAERRFGLYAGPCDCGAVGHVASCSAMKFPVAATIAPLAGVVHVAPDASQVVGHGDACPRCGAFRNPFFPALHDKGCR